jgi:hypothetical protein
MAKRNKRIISLAVCALALAAGLSVKPAMAYFTSYQTASGTVKIAVDAKANLTEEYLGWIKTITVQNTGDTDCYIRVRAIAPNGYTLEKQPESDEWTLGADGYYYYSDPVAPEGFTSALKLKISGQEQIENQAVTNQNYLPPEFNVIILQEASRVLYYEDGTAYADWSQEFSTNQNLQGGE